MKINLPCYDETIFCPEYKLVCCSGHVADTPDNIFCVHWCHSHHPYGDGWCRLYRHA